MIKGNEESIGGAVGYGGGSGGGIDGGRSNGKCREKLHPSHEGLSNFIFK